MNLRLHNQKNKIYFIIASILSLFVTNLWANETLPEPLSLETSLKIASQSNPALYLAQEKISASKARTRLFESDIGFDLSVQARARWVESPKAFRYLGREDHAATVVLNKRLYDFGQTGNRVLSGKVNETISALEQQQVYDTIRLSVMRAFFDVLLADLQFARDTEAMAMGYIYYDRTKEREAVGQRSELETIEKQSFYESTRLARYQSESQQRSTRNYLSLLLDRPDQLPSKLVTPKLKYHKLKIKEVEDLQSLAMENNLQLKILKQKLSALKHELQFIRAQRKPVLSAELEAGVYEREIGGNDVWRAGVVLDIPLYQRGSVSAKSALKNAEIKSLEIEIYQYEQKLRQQVLDHWLALGDLSVQLQAANKEYEYREYYLDRARALYELEVQSDLGDAMVELSAANLKIAETKYEIAMRWETLAQLTQKSIEELVQ